MLAELQQLHALIRTLSRQLQDTQHAYQTLLDQPPATVALEQRVTELKRYHDALQVKQQATEQQLAQRLSENRTLMQRFEALNQAHQTLKAEMQRVTTDLAQQALARRTLTEERDALLQKYQVSRQSIQQAIDRLSLLTPDAEHLNASELARQSVDAAQPLENT